MSIPRSADARHFYRCAFERYREADVLLKANHPTGAVYLAGYAIECILKSLVLQASPDIRRKEWPTLFRGNRAHDFEWLRSLYFQRGGARYPDEIAKQFILVNDWSTELRYTSRTIPGNEANAFLKSVKGILSWAEGRL